MKASTRTSTRLSIVLSGLFLALLGVAAVFVPAFADRLLAGADATWARFTAVGTMYGILLSAVAADLLLIALLRLVLRGEVFTDSSVSLIRAVSWCCMLCGGLSTALGIVGALLENVFLFAFLAAFAAILLGICLRVVKNVIETAMEIKHENELTV